MASVTIKWGPIICECDACICKTLVQYRAEGTATWTTPPTENPTKELEYTIEINDNTYYLVRLTFIGPRCQQKYTEIPIFVAGGIGGSACCPTGYTYSAENDYCIKIEDVPAIAPVSPATLVAKPYQSYGTCGSYIYQFGYSTNGTGTSTQIPLSNPFWKNGGTCADNNTTDGPMNRTAVWVNPATDNQIIGFGICVDVTEEKTYYVGIAADNFASIKVDGQTILTQNALDLGNQYGIGPAATFKIWHIYPIYLTVGPHVLELTGTNVVNVAAVGVEVYDATEEELIAATSYADLGVRLLFSSKDEIGQPAQIGTGGTGYSCPTVPEGQTPYTLASCEEPVKCRRIIITSTQPC